MKNSNSNKINNSSDVETAENESSNIAYGSEEQEYELDISSIFYAHTFNKKVTQSFRVTANLKEEVNKKTLIQAVSKMPGRFPTFFTVLHRSFNSIKLVKKVFLPEQYVIDDDEICAPFDASNENKPLIRVVCGNKKIALEVFHGLSDGTGGVVFLKSLLTVYFNILGDNIPYTCGALNVNEQSRPCETEDSFLKVYEKNGKRAKRNGENAFQLPVSKPNGRLNVSTAHFSASKLKAYAKSLGVSFTEFIVAAYAYSFYLTCGKTDKPVLIQVPINLRGLYNSETLRNFSLYCTTGFPKGELDNSFERMLQVTHIQLNEGKDKNVLQQQINMNVQDALMPLTRIAPTALKRCIIKAGSIIYGENLCTSPMSSVGKVELNEELGKRVESIDIIIGKTHLNSIYACAITYNDILSLSVGSLDSECKIPKEFFRFIEEKIN